VSDIKSRIEEKVKAHAAPIANAIKAAAKEFGHSESGALVRSMKPKVRKDGLDVWGLSIGMKRYGFILHHGMEAQSIERGGFRFLSSGFSGSGFLNQALDDTVPKLADDLSKLGGDLTVNKMNF